jgi:hypothetical protein
MKGLAQYCVSPFFVRKMPKSTHFYLLDYTVK